ETLQETCAASALKSRLSQSPSVAAANFRSKAGSVAHPAPVLASPSPF
ncbi:unnamed protein product, partial [Brassica oleracea]